jgi:hypothetical protein
MGVTSCGQVTGILTFVIGHLTFVIGHFGVMEMSNDKWQMTDDQ